jgi:hypothetical protein
VAGPLALRADIVKYRDGTDIKEVEGNVLAEDASGTLMLEGRDAQHHIIAKSDRISWEKAGKPVPPYTKLQLRASLEKEFGPRFHFRHTKNYLICYSCSAEYADDAAALLESAYRVFANYFNNKGGFQLEMPEQPLVAIVCGSREEYVKIVSKEMGPLANSTAGVYMPDNNRMYMYDALGGDHPEYRRSPAQRQQAAGFATLLKEQNISTVINEGIHQIAFNSGFHNRHARNPIWLVEGMAMFFEAPDLDSKKGWSGVGNVNRERLERFSKTFPRRTSDTLKRLLLDDGLFRDPSTAHDAYAEAWALTYYLCKSKTRSYVKYLRIVNARPPMVPYSSEERLKDFKTAFGKSPEDIDMDFRRYMARVVLKVD